MFVEPTPDKLLFPANVTKSDADELAILAPLITKELTFPDNPDKSEADGVPEVIVAVKELAPLAQTVQHHQKHQLR